MTAGTLFLESLSSGVITQAVPSRSATPPGPIWRRAVVLGHEVHLRTIPMEDMDLVLRPQLQSVDVNPESPNIPLSVAT